MVFGAFDGVHEGHRAMLREAKRAGDYLIAVVAQDHVVQELKHRPPKHDMGSRMEMLQRENLADEIVVGDIELGTYHIVQEHRPSVVAFGYDQDDFRRDFEGHLAEFEWHVDTVTLDPHEPEKYHSSILHG
ncbi:MAG: hypothetical protein A2945_04675 [Candidatus Liptonbacteria bacterium RIFCSPLOWO2_01_FULL_52_25]|uniref:Cytidyltransferase-like domain-containing protein n=1 Tax=Candidatus Liptonbacteria bacterium RIFCSPLOWO2_01_FULL_52_25 TaxID=1798650 RepID=A0A1G2CFP0_9BACT|nr:MAG: hypothetical protein A2945_04675 [Candidatus Liptonbacteria bacterium RIFCSPLOWO2_01_FULL_52_25]